MLDQLFNYISNRIDLSSEAKKYTESISNLKKVEKGNILIGENESVNKTYFVLQGCLRSYVYDSGGKEHTLQFALKNNWISDYIAIFNNEKSTQTVEAISDSTVIEFSINEGIDNICSRFPEIEFIHRKSLERNIVSLQKRILNQLQLSSLERYHLLINKYPEIEKYALSYHIASYLGITQQSLSRLKAE